MADAAKWYVVHTYSGYENTVKATIEKTVEIRHLEELIHEISIPVETVIEMTDKGPKEYERKVFPGYVLAKMVMTDEAWYVIKNVRGVTGFVGSGTKPTALTEEEVAQLGVERHDDGMDSDNPEVILNYAVGDRVTINVGSFAGQVGIVDTIKHEDGKVIVLLDMMGRKMPLELALTDVDPIID